MIGNMRDRVSLQREHNTAKARAIVGEECWMSLIRFGGQVNY
jgi:hypothetical protein